MNKGQGAIARTNKVEPAAAATVTGANNGLSLSGTTVQLGGALIQNTAIDLAGAFNFEIDLNGGARGLFIDSVGFLFQLGDLAPLSAGTNIQIDASANDTVLFKTGGDIGTNFLEFNNGSFFYTYGDIVNANNGLVSLLDSAGLVYSITSNAGASTFFLISPNTGLYQLGDISGSVNDTFFTVDDINGLIYTSKTGDIYGLRIDFTNRTYQLGQIPGSGSNATYLVVDDAAQDVTMYNSAGAGLFLTANENGLLLLNMSGQIMRVNTAFTNNAGVAAGTLLNAPAAGNPTKWIPIDDNGTIRNIPAW